MKSFKLRERRLTTQAQRPGARDAMIATATPCRVRCSAWLGVGVIMLNSNPPHSPINPKHDRDKNGEHHNENQAWLTPLKIVIRGQNSKGQHRLQTNGSEKKRPLASRLRITIGHHSAKRANNQKADN
jgi:hypothetical protein